MHNLQQIWLLAKTSKNIVEFSNIAEYTLFFETENPLVKIYK